MGKRGLRSPDFAVRAVQYGESRLTPKPDPDTRFHGTQGSGGGGYRLARRHLQASCVAYYLRRDAWSPCLILRSPWPAHMRAEPEPPSNELRCRFRPSARGHSAELVLKRRRGSSAVAQNWTHFRGVADGPEWTRPSNAGGCCLRPFAAREGGNMSTATSAVRRQHLPMRPANSMA